MSPIKKPPLGGMLCLVVLLAGCESAPRQDFYATLVNRPMPADDAQRDQECAWLAGEAARMRSVSAMAASSQYALAFQAKAAQNIAALSARHSQIQCDVVRVAPTTPAIPARTSFDQCFAKCREVTERNENQCFDACK